MAPILREETLSELAAEINRARTKFPSNLDLGAALLEEVGEMFENLSEPYKVHQSLTKAEALQVACVAIRIYEEGDPAFAQHDQMLDAGTLEGPHYARKALADAAIGLGRLAHFLLEDVPLESGGK